MREFIQGQARNIIVFMTDSADRSLGKTGLTLTIQTSKAGAALATITPTVTERTVGYYQLAMTAAHLDTLGDLGFYITGTGADPSVWIDQVVLDVAGARATFGVTIGTGSTTTSLVTSAMVPAQTFGADQLKNRIFVFDNDTTTAALRGQVCEITANTSSATPTLTVSTLTASAVSGDKGRVY